MKPRDVYRHFAYFSQESGQLTRERAGHVPAPALPVTLVGEARLMALNQWATDVSEPEPGETGLDVTALQYPLGDFIWAEFDAIDRRLHWPTMHRFLVFDRVSGLLSGRTE